MSLGRTDPALLRLLEDLRPRLHRYCARMAEFSGDLVVSGRDFRHARYVMDGADVGGLADG